MDVLLTLVIGGCWYDMGQFFLLNMKINLDFVDVGHTVAQLVEAL